MKEKKIHKNVEKGRVYVAATFNNTIITITDEKGNTLGWGTSGSVGFKGTRKSTPFAATSAVDQVARKVISAYGLRSVEVFIKGPGSGRDAALRGLKSAGLSISMIADVTPIPHNGARPKKKRRV
ncbi:30S ribosomal protein S11 [Candidatus Gottesmanbacteria bacterium RIFCSPHIGHO2_02_FULL_40_13]|uniref:Small ribosomal subunit protein uS11 n=1 Tax=Candidatus Gottesmanbacteria bacterium RIFCSPHIGHO2_02_FULL_40_13 TaxID=1798384 RepID=A0A1F6A712_9BACT|nr:MAG: 30S ribosomal protein S11 [Candidatus Gottesmanbacteria bacterium RIFCSPHIGHO2_02_FULL_40_13]